MEVSMFLLLRLSFPFYDLLDTLTGVWKHGRRFKHDTTSRQT